MPYLVLLSGMVLTAGTTLVIRGGVRARDAARFENSVGQTSAAIRSRIETHVALLRGLAGLFSGPELARREAFRAYVNQIDPSRNYPGILGLGFSIRTTPAERDRLIEQMRAEGFEDVKATPPGDDRPEVHMILYLEPLDRRNVVALGYDMFSEPVRRAAMEAARDNGEPIASGRVTLVQEIDAVKQPGLLIYVPAYRGPSETLEQRRQNLVGFAYSPLRAKDLFNGIFSAVDVGNSLARDVEFQVFDGADTSAAEHLLYDSAKDQPGNDAHESSNDTASSYTAARTIDVAGRSWGLHVRTRPEFDEASGINLVPWVFFGGLATSLALFLTTSAQARAHRRAEAAAAELRRSESRFRRLFESNLIGVVYSDMQGGVRFGNDEYFRIIGYSREDAAAGRVRWDRITPPEYLPLDERAVDQLNARGVAEPFEKEYLRPDGTRVSVLLGVAMLEGSKTETVAFVLDLTEMKRAQRELHAAKETAEAASRAKDQFLAVLSHELRTPLTPVLALVSGRERDPMLPAELSEELATIRRNVELEARLIDDLLDLTRIHRGKLSLHPEVVDAHALIRGVHDLCCGEDARAKSLSMRLELSADEHFVHGDEARLSQVLWNLIRNAVKFTPADGSVVVRTSNVGASLVIEVRDSGVGIDPKLLPRIFDAFEQGDPALTRRYGGLGLGLAIARNLVELHGGTIRADSAGRDQGATFTVTLPNVPTPASWKQVAPSSDRVGARPLRILLVEDHADTARALRRLLTRLGHDVTTATSVAEALGAVTRSSFDLMLSDIGLSDGNGLELMRTIRAMPAAPAHEDAGSASVATATIKAAAVRHAIAVSGYGTTEDVQRSRDAGFDAHLTKPVDFDALERTILDVVHPDVRE